MSASLTPTLRTAGRVQLYNVLTSIFLSVSEEPTNRLQSNQNLITSGNKDLVTVAEVTIFERND